MDSERGLKLDLRSGTALVDEALAHRDSFDGLLLTGRTGGYLAAILELVDETVPYVVVRSHPRRALKSAEVRERTTEIGMLLERVRYSHDRPPRLLLVDDSVTFLRSGAYAFLHRAVALHGGSLVGCVVSEASFNGMSGYFPHARWILLSTLFDLYQRNPQAFGRRVERMRLEGIAIDPYIADMLE